MNPTEAIKELELIKAAIEWEYPLDWQIALDAMAARIGSRKAQEYANRYKNNQQRELEKFWRNA